MIKLQRKGIVMKPDKLGLGTRARFNPGVVRDARGIHMLFRAADGPIGSKDYISTIGYARLDQPNRISILRDDPLIYPTLPEERGGCEDCRIVPLDGRYYLFYTAYDGKTACVAVAYTTNFSSITKLGVIRFEHWDKDAFVFPERVNGRIVYMHRIEPNIQVLMVDTIEELLDTNCDAWQNHLNDLDQQTVLRPSSDWEMTKIGSGPPPVLTEAGWLLIYHGVDHESVYRVGAALLDKDDPYKVLARLPYPIMEPEEEYERVGDVPNVVFPQGVVAIDDMLYVYYGAADKVVGLAKVSLNELLGELDKYRHGHRSHSL